MCHYRVYTLHFTPGFVDGIYYTRVILRIGVKAVLGYTLPELQQRSHNTAKRFRAVLLHNY